MSSFVFRLQRVLRWRQVQLEVEETKLRQQLARLAEVDRGVAETTEAARRAEVDLRSCPVLRGDDLAALSSFRAHLEKRRRELAVQRVDRQKAVQTQEAALLAARRRCRLLERLKQQREAEWQVSADRELEQLASESFLAGWSRGGR